MVGRIAATPSSDAASLRDSKGSAAGGTEESSRRRAQAALQEGERHFRSVVEKALDVVGIIDADGTIRYVSPSSAALTGHAPEDLIGRNAFDLVHPDDVKRVRARLAPALSLAAQPSTSTECRIRRKSGSWCTLEIVARNLLADPLVAGILINGRDITARKRAERLLRRRAAEIEDLYDQAPCGYHSLDRSGLFVGINKTELAWLGYSRDEIIGRKRFPDVITPASQELFARHRSAFLRTGSVTDLELEMVRKDGTTFPVLLSATAVRDARGRIVRSRSTLVDLTERKAAEDVARSSERRFRHFLDAAPDAVLVVSRDGQRIEFANRRAEQLFGYRAEELVGQPVELLVPEGAGAWHVALRDRHAAAPSPQPPGSGLEVSARRRDGSAFLADVMLGPVDLGADRFFAVVRDATEATLAERARRERTRLLDAVFDHSLSCLVLLDTRFNFVRVNLAYAQACRRSLDDFVGRNHFDLFPSEAQAIFEQVVRTKQPFAVAARPFSFPDQPERGETYWDWTLVPLLDDHGEVELLLFSLHDVSEHVATAQALRTGEERFRSLIEHSLDLIAIIDREGAYRYANPAHEAACGFRPDELVGKSAFALLHPDDAQVLMRRLTSALASDETGAIVEYRLRSKDGSWRFIEAVALNLVDDPGVGGVLVTGRDVTERRRAEAELRAHGERLEVSLRVANIAAFTQDRDLRYTWMQHPQLGYTVDQILGRSDADLLPREGLEGLLAVKRRVIETGFPAREEVHVTTRGRNLHFDVALEPLRDASGAVIGLTGASFDITERKRAVEIVREHALRLEIVQEVYRAILEARSVREVVAAALQRIRLLVPCDVAIALLVDAETGVARVIGAEAANADRVRDLSALPLGDFSPLTVFVERPEIYVEDIAASTGRSPIVQRLYEDGARTLLTESLISGGEVLGMFTLTAPTPAAFAAEQRAIAREVADQLAVAIDRARLHERLERHAGDLEQRVQERTRKLERANHDLRSFTSSVSHDLRAPLRRIEGFSRALLEDYGATLEPQARQYVDAIVQSSGRMGQLIEDLLRLARLAQHEIVRERVDLSAMADAIGRDLQNAEPGRSVTWRVAPGIAADGDARLLRIVLENLLGNAWKFTSRHPTACIAFDVDDRDGQRVYRVRDDGAGFDMANAERLFGVFQRLHSDADFEGTGIGLATVQRIIEGHGGRIWADGAIERGATFSFTLGS